jgi:hypothetical protein
MGFPFTVYCDFYKTSFRFTRVRHIIPLRDSDFELEPGV